MAALLKWDPAKAPVPVWIEPPLKALLGWAPILVIVFVLVNGASAWARKRITSPRTLAVIQSILDNLRDETFRKEDEKKEPQHNHRVTLFTHAPRSFQGKWLIPIVRSGHLTQDTETRFRVGDDPNRLEGIAGHAWSLKSGVTVPNLPDLNQVVAGEKEIEEYARKTLVTPEWVRKRLSKGKPLARSYYATPVEVSGVRWGVLVVDSMNPEAKVSDEDMLRYRVVVALLEKVLEGM
jgi:hypothetical protein